MFYCLKKDIFALLIFCRFCKLICRYIFLKLRIFSKNYLVSLIWLPKSFSHQNWTLLRTLFLVRVFLFLSHCGSLNISIHLFLHFIAIDKKTAHYLQSTHIHTKHFLAWCLFPQNKKKRWYNNSFVLTLFSVVRNNFSLSPLFATQW